MNVSIIGGTSHVATELGLIFREWGHSVTPTARSRVSASFLNDQEFDPVIGDITNRETMREAVGGGDAIAISAFARQYSKGFNPKDAHRTNVEIVQNAVTEAPANASLIYFSTITIYHDETGFSRFDSYATEKRRIERTFLDKCSKHGKDGYVFRMGPVYGENQGNTQQIRAKIDRHSRDGKLHHIGVDEERPSNVLHTVTIADAIETVHDRKHDSDIVTLVNEPQWTWRDVFEHYVPSRSEVVFHPQERENGDGLVQWVASTGSSVLESNERTLRSLSVYFPERLNDRIFNEYVKRKVEPSLASFDAPDYVELAQFDQESAPGDRLNGLTNTADLLAELGEIESLKSVEQIETKSSGSVVQF